MNLPKLAEQVAATLQVRRKAPTDQPVIRILALQALQDRNPEPPSDDTVAELAALITEALARKIKDKEDRTIRITEDQQIKTLRAMILAAQRREGLI